MRALQIVSDHQIKVQDAPVPEIAPDEVLVKVAGAGLCHSDLHVLHMDGWPVVPMTLGHETAGHIEQLGDSVVGFAEGDPVLVYLVWACGICRACIEGRDNVCITTAGAWGSRRVPASAPTAAWPSTSRSATAFSNRSARSTRAPRARSRMPG